MTNIGLADPGPARCGLCGILVADPTEALEHVVEHKTINALLAQAGLADHADSGPIPFVPIGLHGGT